MASFSLPAFARLTPKIHRAERELAQMEALCEACGRDGCK